MVVDHDHPVATGTKSARDRSTGDTEADDERPLRDLRAQ
jgi:hypothetical protein